MFVLFWIFNLFTFSFSFLFFGGRGESNWREGRRCWLHSQARKNIMPLMFSDLAKIRDKASRIVNHVESTIALQRTVVFPLHTVICSLSHFGDSICKNRLDLQ